MNKLLIAAALIGSGIVSASAADLSAGRYTKAPAIVSDPWSGAYVGATAGYGFGDASTDLTPNAAALGGPGIGLPPFGPLPTGPRMDGFVGGGEIGYNWRFGNILTGLEADLSYSSLGRSNSATGIPFIGGTYRTTIDAKLEWFGTVRGRIGFLVTNDFLVYGTGGFAYGGVDTTVTGTNLAANCPFNNCFSGSTGAATGWTAGAGAEHAFAPKWTAKLEYLYLDFGKHTFVMNDAVNVGATVTASTHTTVNVVRAGLNYHF